MSITSQTARSGPLLIAGFPQVLPTGFPFQQGSDLLVLNIGPVAAPYGGIPLTLGSDYTVSGGAYNSQTQMQVGSITVVSGGAGNVQINDQIMILRNVPINQVSSLSPTEPLTVQVIEKALDKQATLSQELDEKAGRSLHFEAGETLDATMFLALRKNKIPAFDANGALFWVPNTVNPVDASNDLVTATGSTTPRILAQRFAEVVNVLDFGASNLGVIDSTTSIQAAINYAKARYSLDGLPRCVFLPAGKYKVSATITNGTTGSPSDGVSIIGAGMKSSVFVRSTDYGDTLKVCGAYAGGNNVQGLGFVATGNVTSGAHLVCQQIAYSVVSDIYFEGGFISLKIQGVYRMVFDRFCGVSGGNFPGTGPVAGSCYIQIVQNGVPFPTFDTFFSNFHFANSTIAVQRVERGIDIQQCDGLWFNNGHIISAWRQCDIRPDTSYIAQNLQFNNVFFDGGCNTHLQITGAGSVFGARFNLCVYGGSDGVSMADSTAINCTNARGVHFNFCEWGTNVASALRLVAGKYIDVKDCIFIDNASNATSNVMQVESGCSFVSIEDNTFGTTPTVGAALFLNGATDMLVDGNRFSEVTGADITINVYGARSTMGLNCSSRSDTAIASAATPAIPACGDFFQISGTTTITNFPTPNFNGRKIRLFFAAALTVTNGAALKLTGSVNLTTTAGTILEMTCLSGIWYENARSVK